MLGLDFDLINVKKKEKTKPKKTPPPPHIMPTSLPLSKTKGKNATSLYVEIHPT